MASLPKMGRKWGTFLHSIGLSSIGGALFLQITVFSNIAKYGYFRGIEQNQVVLTAEIALTAFAVTYFAYMFLRFLWSQR